MIPLFQGIHLQHGNDLSYLCEMVTIDLNHVIKTGHHTQWKEKIIETCKRGFYNL